MDSFENVKPETLSPSEDYEFRKEILNELHARPFEKIEVPRRIFLMAFLTDFDAAQHDRQQIEQLCLQHNLAPLSPTSSYHSMAFGSWNFRWEQHNEFTTYRLDTELQAEANLEDYSSSQLLDILGFSAPGPLVVATEARLSQTHLERAEYEEIFNPASFCFIETDRGRGRVAGDFQPNHLGFTRFMIEDHGMSANRAGALVQRLLEVETYRMLALMGLPVAKTAMPVVNETQDGLAALTAEIASASTMEDNHELLRKLTDLAASLEAQAAQTSYRFSASQAYYDIVSARLNVMHENSIDGARRFSSFFQRRLTPAMSTCRTVEERQNSLSRKLMRTAELLRTRIQFELEQQNRDLLTSMNRRAKLQLRLQQTVEGLSVAAISYYVVGLVKYLTDGLFKYDLTLGLSPTLLTACSVPIVILVVWFLTHRIHKSFSDDD